MIKLVTTFFYVGRLTPAPGTWASIVAILAGYLIHALGGFPAFATATVAVFIIGWIAITVETNGSEDHDPSEIVIDAVVGQWIALLPISFVMEQISLTLEPLGIDTWFFPYPFFMFALLMFRLFDIWKPGPVGWANRMGSPLGTMLDDAIAGLMVVILELGAILIAYIVFSNAVFVP